MTIRVVGFGRRHVEGTPALVALFVIPEGMYNGGSDTEVVEEGECPCDAD